MPFITAGTSAFSGQLIWSNPDGERVRIASRDPFPRAMQTALDQPQVGRFVFIKGGSEKWLVKRSQHLLWFRRTVLSPNFRE